MEWVETTGKSIDEAKEAALDELGVDEHDAEFEVIEEAKLGLFGRVRSEARVRARVRPTTPRPKDDRRDRRRRRTRSADGAAEAGSETGVAPGDDLSSPPPPADAPAAGSAAPGPAGRRRGRTRSEGGEPIPAAPTGGMLRAEGAEGDEGAESADTAGSADLPGSGGGVTTPSGSSTSRARRRRPSAGQDEEAASGRDQAPQEAVQADAGAPRGGGRASGRSRASGAKSDDQRADPAGSEGDTPMDVALQDQADAAQRFLDGLLREFGLEARISAASDDGDERVDLKVEGANLGLLIGPKGSTLLAIQDLTRSYVQQHTKARNGRVFVDVAGYREKRAEALAGFVHKVAGDVVASGKPVALEPMSAPDRKIIHDTAAEIPGIETRSEGEDERRHVIISPRAETAEAS